MTITDGTTEKDTRRNSDSLVSYSPQRLGIPEGESRVYGTEQNRADNASCSGKNFSRKAQQRKAPAGKILERLKLVENEYLSYVKGDQEKLEARLGESREREENFKKAVQELEQEIYDLVSAQEDEDSP